MRRSVWFAIRVGCLAAALWATAPAAPASAATRYLSPRDGARYVLPETGLIVRPGGRVDPSSLRSGSAFAVSGSRSGSHPGRAVLSDDRLAIVWRPDTPFLPGERVNWSLARGVRLESGKAVDGASAAFEVAGPERAAARPLDVAAMIREEITAAGGGSLGAPPIGGWPLAPGWVAAARADTLPPDFPPIYRTVEGPSAAGRIFLASFSFVNPLLPSYLMILEDDGTPVFYRKVPNRAFDFKMQPDGRLTYFDDSVGRFYALDAQYAVVDSFACGNGYQTDLHDLRVLPDGHALVMAYDPETVDMSVVVPGGNPAATVLGLIVQELDRDKNVVFEWRSWDHFQITDATHVDLTASSVDYVHGNAVELDTDGNLLISSRHMEEITKIDRQTGDVLWRFGGKNNQFTFVNDTVRFSYQHAIRRIANGDVTLFDNGNYHDSPFSRAVEYRLDESAMEATMVWQYQNLPLIWGFAMGYVQRLDDGNTLIGWGTANPTVTEVNARGEMVGGLTFDAGTISYRAYRFPWYPERAAGARAPLAAEFLAPRSHPFRSGGALAVVVHREAIVTVRMFDVRGRLVRTLLDHALLTPGTRDVPIDGAGLRSGIYYCRVRAEGRQDTSKIVLVR
ncbi:MAG TPA: aryl-sulfate sulfotransferase [Candidatus Eisenbacteria bacterium]